MDPGDALFFHCNTLHASSQNTSDHSRNVLLCCYNRVDNDPYKDHHHPRATALRVVDDAEIKRRGLVLAGEQRAFYRAEADLTIEPQHS